MLRRGKKLVELCTQSNNIVNSNNEEEIFLQNDRTPSSPIAYFDMDQQCTIEIGNNGPILTHEPISNSLFARNEINNLEASTSSLLDTQYEEETEIIYQTSHVPSSDLRSEFNNFETHDVINFDITELSFNSCHSIVDAENIQSRDLNSQLVKDLMTEETEQQIEAEISSVTQLGNSLVPYSDSSTSDKDTSYVSVSMPVRKKRKRKENVKYPTLTKEEKYQRDVKKHPLNLVKHNSNCSKQCTRNITEDTRRLIWKKYWMMSYSERRSWLARHIRVKAVKRHRTSESEPYKRQESRDFLLYDDNNFLRSVCKSFFLNTLGYKNDSVITSLITAMKRKPLSPITENRGSFPKPKSDITIVQNHILTYKPCCSHYRRYNAPNVLYLSNDLTLQQMYNDFKSKHAIIKGYSIEIYRRTIKDMNISFKMPKSDICADCLLYENKFKEYQSKNIVLSLKDIAVHVLHKFKAQSANIQYKADMADPPSNVKIYSMDLQKTILLPVMPHVKDCFFINRLVVFNLTFASLKKNSKDSYCILWHEAVGGRDAADFINSIFKLIRENRDTSDFIFWCDNCSSQNKNWILYTSMVRIVNSESGPLSITFKYLTKGHTHMTADGIHGNIESAMKKKRHLYDFDDFFHCVLQSRANLNVATITENDRYDWQKKKRHGKKKNKKKDENDPLNCFLINVVVEVKFVKGSNNLFYKKQFCDQYQEINFLQKRFQENMGEFKNKEKRGILKKKKDEIVEKLVPLMPANRRFFWENLPTNNTVPDLQVENQIDILPII